jgi:hypothetical protein
VVRTGRWEPTFTAKRTNGSAKQRADILTIEASGKFHLPLRNTTSYDVENLKGAEHCRHSTP